MIEKASGKSRTASILSQAPDWFCRSVDLTLEARGDKPLNIQGRKANDRRFSEKQRKINREMEAKQAMPMTAKQRVQDKAKRLKAQRKVKR